MSHSDDAANTGKDNLLMEEKLKSGLRSEFITEYLKGDADVLNSVEMKFEEIIRNQEFRDKNQDNLLMNYDDEYPLEMWIFERYVLIRITC